MQSHHFDSPDFDLAFEIGRSEALLESHNNRKKTQTDKSELYKKNNASLARDIKKNREVALKVVQNGF